MESMRWLTLAVISCFASDCARAWSPWYGWNLTCPISPGVRVGGKARRSTRSTKVSEHREPELTAAVFPSGEISKSAGSSGKDRAQATWNESKATRTNCFGFSHRTYKASPDGESSISRALAATRSLRENVRLPARISCTEPLFG